MKKIVLFFLLILALALPVFAEDGTAQVQINAKVPSGTGTGEKGDITVGGVNIKIAYQKDGVAPSNTTWPTGAEKVTGAASTPKIIADLVQDGTDQTGCKTLYLLVGVTGNPETETDVTVSFDAPGWYSGSEGKTEGSQPVSNLELHCATTVTATSGTKVSASYDGQASDTDNKPIVITHAVGAQKDPVLAGYAKLTWGITKDAVVNAGDYSTTITITITGDGESQTT